MTGQDGAPQKVQRGFYPVFCLILFGFLQECPMRLMLVACVFVLGVYFGLRAEEGGKLEVVVEAIAQLVQGQQASW